MYALTLIVALIAWLARVGEGVALNAVPAGDARRERHAG